MSYASLADLKAALRITDAVDDVILQAALDAATTAIDDHCNRTFVADGAASIRYFDVDDRRIVVDDIYTVTGLIVSIRGAVIPVAVENVSAGYVMEPRNALAHGEPFTSIRYEGAWMDGGWPLISLAPRTTAAITARWGYAAAIPGTVSQACLLQASRIFARRLSPYGVAGSPDLGSEIRLLAKVDPDVAVLLAGKVRY